MGPLTELAGACNRPAPSQTCFERDCETDPNWWGWGVLGPEKSLRIKAATRPTQGGLKAASTHERAHLEPRETPTAGQNGTGSPASEDPRRAEGGHTSVQVQLPV